MAAQLTEKIEIVALNKIDAVEPDELKKQKDRLKRAAKKTPLLMSGVTGQGVKEALQRAGRCDRRGAGQQAGQARGRDASLGRPEIAASSRDLYFACAMILSENRSHFQHAPKQGTWRARKTSSGSCATSFAMTTSAAPAIPR